MLKKFEITNAPHILKEPQISNEAQILIADEIFKGTQITSEPEILKEQQISKETQIMN